MRYGWTLSLVLLVGCAAVEQPTQQVANLPFTAPRGPMPLRVNYPPPSPETAERLVVLKDKLLGANPQFGIRPYVFGIGSAEAEVFHMGTNSIYVSEGLVRQCQSEAQLAAILANELGRMISEREAAVSEEVRQPERLPPIQVPIGGNGNANERDGLYAVEMARYEKNYPRQPRVLPPPNPQLIAREVLERAGYQRTDLDAAEPLLQAAARNSIMEGQFKGTLKQGNWKSP